jgi:hypothetical protein
MNPSDALGQAKSGAHRAVGSHALAGGISFLASVLPLTVNQRIVGMILGATPCVIAAWR